MKPADTAHQISFNEPPMRWMDGFPLGNGEFGVMIWGGGNPLRFSLDRADLWDLRENLEYSRHPDYNYAGLRRLVAEGKYDEALEIFEGKHTRDNPIGPTKISIGRAEIAVGDAVSWQSRLDLLTATVEGEITTAEARHTFQAFVHKLSNVLCVRVDPAPAGSEMEFIPLAQMCEDLAKLGHPAPVVTREGDVVTLTQEIPEYLFYSLVWNSSGPEYYLAAESGKTAEEAAARTRQTWELAKTSGFDSLIAQHVKEWDEFWSGSDVYLPEPDAELLWHYGIYMLASSAKRGAIPPGLQGLWAMDGVMPPWRGDYHADMNVQEVFWNACGTGHIDLLDSWCDHMKNSIEPARAFTRNFFGTEGTFWLCCTMPDYTKVPCWYPTNLGWSHSGWLGWLVWLRWRYSMDKKWLTETGYPVLSEVFKFYKANLELDDDGCLHIPISNSPEYKDNMPDSLCKDPNIDIALVRRCCDWICEMESALGIDVLSDSAGEIHDKLVPYHLTGDGVLCLWKDKPLDESHRHPSHLMAIHPAMDITIDGGAEALRIIQASLEQYNSLGWWRWAGHSYAQLISLASVVGRAGMAHEYLRQFVDHWVGRNGLHFNRDLDNSGMSHFRLQGEVDLSETYSLPFTMEANNAFSQGVCDMLVQGWNDTLRVFPAVPRTWRDVAFRDLATEGAFRVSATRLNGNTEWVKIRAGVDRTLRLVNPFGAEPFDMNGKPATITDGVLVVSVRAGEEIVLTLPGLTVPFEDAIVRVRNSNISRFDRQEIQPPYASA